MPRPSLLDVDQGRPGFANKGLQMTSPTNRPSRERLCEIREKFTQEPFNPNGPVSDQITWTPSSAVNELLAEIDAQQDQIADLQTQVDCLKHDKAQLTAEREERNKWIKVQAELLKTACDERDALKEKEKALYKSQCDWMDKFHGLEQVHAAVLIGLDAVKKERDLAHKAEDAKADYAHELMAQRDALRERCAGLQLELEERKK